MNNDFDYIKELFDGDGVKAPDSLSEDKIMAMLPDIDDTPAEQAPSIEFKKTETSTKPNKNRVRRYIALAACALVALIGVPQLYDHIAGPPDTSLVDGELRTFENYNEIERLVKSMNSSSDSGFRLFKLGRGADEAVEEEALDYDAGSAPAENSTSAKSAETTGNSSATDHSETYLQVDEVDEADIVKTDGKYIYYVTDTQEVVILSAKDGKTERLSKISNDAVENYIDDIYLKGDKLITIGRVYDEDDDEGYSAVVTYDVSDRSKPKLINEFRQSGYVMASRMVGDYVYLVTNDYAYSGGHVIPKCTIDGNYDSIPVSDICCVPEPTQTSYVILSAVDTASGKQSKSKTKAIFGASDTIYCNNHNLYTAVTEWDNKNQTTYTRVLRASLDGLKVRFDATAKVRGYVNNQFSMNEKDGHFFIATTGSRNGMDVNNLFVLDNKLKEVGKVTGFARNENIKSVRFVGDKAYVITYEQIDPLFIIDVSDPTDPRIEGEVKIDGFSTLLIPVGSDKLLGIGYATGDNGYGGEYSAGLKLSLFDISNPSKPTVIDSKEFENMDSQVQYTHLALTVNTKEGWYAFPYNIYKEYFDEDVIDDDSEEETEIAEPADVGNENGVLVFSANDGLKVIDQHKLDSEYLIRSVYIGDYIYALDGNGEACSFKLK